MYPQRPQNTRIELYSEGDDRAVRHVAGAQHAWPSTGKTPPARAALRAVRHVVHGAIGDDEARTHGFSAGEVADFSVNSNPLGPAPLVAEAVSRVDVARYPDDGAVELRSALARRFDLPLNRIIAGNGSAELLWLLCLAYLSDGDRVAVLGPTFGEYERAAQIMGARLVLFTAAAEGSFVPDLDVVIRQLRARPPRMVIVCNPNNPTGTYLPHEALDALAAALPESLLIVDEAYAGFLHDGIVPASFERLGGEFDGAGTATGWGRGLAAMLPLLARGNVVLVRSLTKDCALAGLRLGYALGSEALVATLVRVKPPWSVNRAALDAGCVSLAAEAHLERGRRAAQEAVTVLQQGFRAHGLHVFETAANFFLTEVGSGARVRAALLRRGLVVRDCASFGLPSLVRVAARTLPECQRLVAAIGQVV